VATATKSGGIDDAVGPLMLRVHHRYRELEKLNNEHFWTLFLDKNLRDFASKEKHAHNKRARFIRIKPEI